MPTIPGTDTKVTPDMLEPIMAKATTFAVTHKEAFVISLSSCNVRNGKQDQEVGGNSD